MQRIVVDTNVLVSAFIQKSYPYLIIDSFPTKDVQWCISDDILEEYTDVLKRAKFSKYKGFSRNAQSLLTDIGDITVKYYPEIKLAIIKDLSDNKFLELAAAINADFLITGNTKDFTMSSFGQTEIITPKEYWETYRQVHRGYK
jgi:putative PIN family toxin of toxin-antitoxin system